MSFLNPKISQSNKQPNSSQIEQTFTKDKLQLVTNILRSLKHLYVRSKCSKWDDTLRFADKTDKFEYP